jgi:hypothetical protein
MCTSFEQTCNPIWRDDESLFFLYPLAEVDFLSFIDDFHFDSKVILDHEAFIFTLAHSPRLSSNNLSDLVYEFYEIGLS